MSHLPESSPLPYSVTVHDVSLWPSSGRWLLVVALAVGAWLATAWFQPAQAGGVNWSIGVTFPGAVAYPAPPVYQTYPSAPVYQTYPSAPVYQTYPAAPVVVYPARPAVQAYPVMPPQVVYGYGGHHHRRHHNHHWQHDRYDGRDGRGHGGGHHDRGYQRGRDR